MIASLQEGFDGDGFIGMFAQISHKYCTCYDVCYVFFDVPVACGKKRLWQKKQCHDFACLTSKEVSDLGCVLAMKAFGERNTL